MQGRKLVLTICLSMTAIGIQASASQINLMKGKCTIRDQSDRPAQGILCTVGWAKGGRTVFIDNNSATKEERYLSQDAGGKFKNSGQYLQCLQHQHGPIPWDVCPSREILLKMIE